MARRASKNVDNGQQLLLPFGPVRNRELLSNHWFEHRLPLEPEWSELEKAAQKAAEKLIDLWRIEKDRAPKYGDEAGLEEKLIQPVFEILGWKLKYQTFLQGREPDYALFISDSDLDRALDAGRRNEDFWAHAALVADAKAWHVSLDRRPDWRYRALLIIPEQPRVADHVSGQNGGETAFHRHPPC